MLEDPELVLEELPDDTLVELEVELDIDPEVVPDPDGEPEVLEGKDVEPALELEPPENPADDPPLVEPPAVALDEPGLAVPVVDPSDVAPHAAPIVETARRRAIDELGTLDLFIVGTSPPWRRSPLPDRMVRHGQWGFVDESVLLFPPDRLLA